MGTLAALAGLSLANNRLAAGTILLALALAFGTWSQRQRRRRP